MGKIIVAVFLYLLYTTCIQTVNSSLSVKSCKLSCENLPGDLISSGPVAQGRPGKMGPVGPKGDQGVKGRRGIQGPPGDSCECSHNDDLITKIQRMQRELDELKSRSKLAPSGWYRASNGLHYKFFNDRVNYDTARKRCAAFDARLVATGMRFSATRNEIKQLLPKPIVNTWIGLNDLVTKGEFVWSDGVISNEANTDWHSGEPNNFQKACGVLHRNLNGQIADNDCLFHTAYLCEF